MGKEKLYYCDHRKNTPCHKDECYSVGRDCFSTIHKKYSANGFKKLVMIIRYRRKRIK